MQPLLRRHGQTAFLRHGDEVAEVSQLHDSYPSKVWLRSYKVFLQRASTIYIPHNSSDNALPEQRNLSELELLARPSRHSNL